MRIGRWLACAVALGLVAPGVAGAAIRTYAVGGEPGRIAKAPDGSLWFTQTSAVGRITMAGVSRSFGLPAARAAPQDVLGIMVAPDGSAWAAEASGSIAHIQPTGPVAEFAPPVLGMPAGILVQPDGQILFSDASLGRLVRFDGGAQFFDTILGNVTGAYFRSDPASPTEMVATPDGAVWILQLAPGRVGRLAPDGSVSYFWLPSGAAAAPTGIALGRDGALWIAEAGVNRIARMAPDGSVKEYKIPSTGAEPRAIAAGPDGAMWFTELGRDRLGRITGTGDVTEYQLPTGSQPYGIVGGADGALWTTLWGKGGQVARVTTDTPTVASAAKRQSAKTKTTHKRKARRRAARQGLLSAFVDTYN